MATFPFLDTVHTDDRHLPAGTWIFREYQRCDAVGFIVSGAIRVLKEHEGGRRMTLYTLGPGDSCVLSMACALSNPIHQASAVAEGDTVVRTVSTETFHRLMANDAAARDYVFGLFAARLADVMALLDDIVFGRIDQRMAALLLERTDGGRQRLVATHERLAEELGTAREVVSRCLRHLATQEAIVVGRGVVDVISPDLLRETVRRVL